jgi:hypothetical protein
MSQPTIESILNEKRLFEPPAEFASQARINGMAAYEALYQKAAADPATFWAELAEQELHWFKNGIRCWTGNLPLPSGLWGASSTFPTIA